MPLPSTAECDSRLPLCVIALGGNLDDPDAAFRRAVDALSGAGFIVRRLSSFIRSEPVDCEPGAPVFLNAVLSGYWKGTPLELLELCQKIEADNGRPNEHPFHRSRTLDLDIILFGDLRMNTERLVIPHPRAFQRDFVLVPLREIEPDLIEQLKPL